MKMTDKKELRKLLLRHFERYPAMQIRDMVKLIYQNEFAGGHLITNEKDSIDRLIEEFETLSKHDHDAQGLVPFEEIANGLCRLHLKKLIDSDISLETVNQMFVSTATSVLGSIDSFEDKLTVFRQCCIDKELPYPAEDVDAYLADYKSMGYPAVSHSEPYRQAYSPAYRIIKSEYMHYFDVFRKIDQLLSEMESVKVAVEGNSGAGKSTLASLIRSVYDCNVFHMDDFFLRPELKTKERLKEVGGNVDYVRFKEEVLSNLLHGGAFQYRVYDCQQMNFGEHVTVTPKRLNIIEGSYSMHPTLAGYYDLKIFLEIDEKDQSSRILKRNGAFMHKRFINEWIPMENLYFSEMKIKEQCDLVYYFTTSPGQSRIPPKS